MIPGSPRIDEQRFHSLDALRAGALLLGIALHATMSFLPGFRDTGWPISDVSESASMGVLFYVVHIFRMATFFLVAGFFARMLYQRLGARGFIRNRLRRIALRNDWPILELRENSSTFPPFLRTAKVL